MRQIHIIPSWEGHAKHVGLSNPHIKRNLLDYEKKPHIVEQILNDTAATPYEHATARQEAAIDALCGDLLAGGSFDRLTAMRRELLGDDN